MKSLFTFLFILSVVNVNSQSNKSPTIYQERFELQPEGLIYYRMPSNFKYANSNSKRYFDTVESILNYYLKQVKLNKTIEDYGHGYALDLSGEVSIHIASMADATINTSVYNDELRWYNNYNRKIIENIRRIKDSTIIANENKIRDSLRFVDSISVLVSDSLNKAQRAKYWKGLADTEADFKDIYGTESEYRMQSGLSFSDNGNNGGGRVILGGMKIYWFNELSIWMQHNGYGVDTKTTGNENVWIFTEKIVSNRTPYKIVATISLNSERRIQNIILKGNIIPIIDLFVGYWFGHGESRPYLNDNGKIERRFMNDKIILKRIGNTGVITVNGQ